MMSAINFRFLAALSSATILTSGDLGIPNFWEWTDRCQHHIPHFQEIKEEWTQYRWKSATWEEFSKAVQLFSKMSQERAHELTSGAKPSSPTFPAPILCQKVAKGTKLIFFGDRHGDVLSLLDMMKLFSNNGVLSPDDPFQIVDPNVIFIGLGDYVDSGIAGVEVIQTLLWFYLRNPDQVILLRGNHEDCDWTKNQNGFQKELKAKFPDVPEEELMIVHQIYDFLPIAAYLGTREGDINHYIFCSHGFIEPGYDPGPLFDKMKEYEVGASMEYLPALNRKHFVSQLPADLQETLKKAIKMIPEFEKEWKQDGQVQVSPRNPVNLGFLYGLILVDTESEQFQFDTEKRAWRWGDRLSREILSSWSRKHSKIHWVVRAHQHKDQDYKMLKKIIEDGGIGRSWTDDTPHFSHGVYTLQMSPDNELALPDPKYDYPGVRDDIWLEVTIGDEGKPWSQKIYRSLR